MPAMSHQSRRGSSSPFKYLRVRRSLVLASGTSLRSARRSPERSNTMTVITSLRMNDVSRQAVRPWRAADNKAFVYADISELSPMRYLVENYAAPKSADLASLSIGSLTLSPAFAADKTEYTAATTMPRIRSQQRHRMEARALKSRSEVPRSRMAVVLLGQAAAIR